MDSMAVDPDFARAIIQNTGVRWSKEEFCDLRITVGERAFACSQFHLCACSEFFDVLLHPGLSTSKSTKFPEIRISGIRPEIFALVLNAIFKGENNINADNMIELWCAANHLQITFLIQKCETFIADRLTVENYFKIYHQALILKSEFVLDKIFAIMTSNFEQLRHSQAFLDISAQTLLKLIERKDFEFYDSVIDFIIHWVGNDDDNKEEFTCNMIVNNIGKDLQQCIQDRGGTFVEVIFKNETLHPEFMTTPTKRKDLLGTLISHAQLNQVSNEGLKMLLENDLVMDDKEARNAVRKALTSVLELEKKVTRYSDTTIRASETIFAAPRNSSGNVDNLEPVVLFVKNKKLMAYTILTNQFFNINIERKFRDIFIYNGDVYALLVYTTNKMKKLMFCTILQALNIKIICRELECSLNDKYIYKDSFLYNLTSTLRNRQEICRMNCPLQTGSGVWTNVGYFKKFSTSTLISVDTFKKYILAFYYDTKDNVESYYVHYFDTNTRMSDSTIAVLGRIDSQNGPPHSFATFRFNERLFALCGNGNLTEILEKDGFINCMFLPSLWDFYLKLYGAAVLDQTLYIFADIDKTYILPTACQFGSIHFVQFLEKAGRCHFMNVPQNWLNVEL